MEICHLRTFLYPYGKSAMTNKQQKLNAASHRHPVILLLAGALLLACGNAAAQYVWIDASGHKVFSDRSPPGSVPLKHILKAPNLAQFQKAAADADAADAAAAKEKATPAKAPPTLAERNAEYIKQKAAEQDKATKDADDAKRKADNQKACASTRDNLRLLNSGTRIGTVNAAGERGYMGDAEKAQKIQEGQAALANCN